MLLRFAKKKDESIYSCSAKNSLGNAISSFARVTVEGKSFFSHSNRFIFKLLYLDEFKSLRT